MRRQRRAKYRATLQAMWRRELPMAKNTTALFNMMRFWRGIRSASVTIDGDIAHYDFTFTPIQPVVRYVIISHTIGPPDG